MRRPRIPFLTSAAFLVFSTAVMAEPGPPQPDGSQGAAYTTGQIVMAKSPKVVLRDQPDEKATAIPCSLAGIWTHVAQVEGDWLKIDEGWLRTSEVVREDAVVEYFTAQLAHDETAFNYLARARGWLKRREYDKAQGDALVHRGILYSQRNEREKALADLNEALRLTPGDVFARCSRADCYIEMKEFNKAIQDAEEALRLDPKSDFAKTTLQYAQSAQRLAQLPEPEKKVNEGDGDDFREILDRLKSFRRKTPPRYSPPATSDDEAKKNE